MPVNKLFIICPECQLESIIKQNYGENVFFISGLGGVYFLDEFREIEELNDLLYNENIRIIYIVNSLDCSFLKNVINKSEFKDTEIEKEYNNLYINNIEQFLHLRDNKTLGRKLVKLNLEKQLNALKNAPYLGSKIEDGKIQAKGLIIDKAEDLHEEITIEP